MIVKEIEAAINNVRYQRNIKGRVEALQKAATVPYFKQCLEYAYDPYLRFGMALNEQTKRSLLMHAASNRTAGLDIDDPDIWDLLNEFSRSTESSSTKLGKLQRLMERCSFATAQVVVGIVDKSLIPKVQASTVAKAFPGIVSVFKLQLANKYTDRKVKKFPAVIEPKYDGVRAAAIVLPTGEVEVVTRTGRDIPAAGYFHEQLLTVAEAYAKVVGEDYRGVVIDGELLGETFNNTVSVFRSKEVAQSGTFNVFDMIPVAVLREGVSSEPYIARRKKMQATFNNLKLDKVNLSPAYQVNSKEEIWRVYENHVALGYEGVIVKNPEGTWEPKRSNSWLKIKGENTADLLIIGAFEGDGEMEGTLGGLIVDFDGVEVRVGSGFSHEDRDIIWAMFLEDLDRGHDYDLIGQLVEVQYQEVTPAKSLRHPVFKRLRTDKHEVSF